MCVNVVETGEADNATPVGARTIQLRVDGRKTSVNLRRLTADTRCDRCGETRDGTLLTACMVVVCVCYVVVGTKCKCPRKTSLAAATSASR